MGNMIVSMKRSVKVICTWSVTFSITFESYILFIFCYFNCSSFCSVRCLHKRHFLKSKQRSHVMRYCVITYHINSCLNTISKFHMINYRSNHSITMILCSHKQQNEIPSAKTKAEVKYKFLYRQAYKKLLGNFCSDSVVSALSSHECGPRSIIGNNVGELVCGLQVN